MKIVMSKNYIEGPLDIPACIYRKFALGCCFTQFILHDLLRIFFLPCTCSACTSCTVSAFVWWKFINFLSYFLCIFLCMCICGFFAIIFFKRKYIYKCFLDLEEEKVSQWNNSEPRVGKYCWFCGAWNILQGSRNKVLCTYLWL